MKRPKVYFILACLLAILSIVAIVYKKGGFRKNTSLQKSSTAFTIKDTTTISKIFMADMFGSKVLLTKSDQCWMVDNKKPAAMYNINSLLATLTAIQVAQPVSKISQQGILKLLSVSATKVEIYATQPLFKLFGQPFFIKERLIKTYFMGDATPTNLGSYAIVEGMSEPYIIYKPGFRGYVTPIFSPKPIDWYSSCIFNIKLTRIQNASFIDIENPENSFYVEKSGPRTFSLFDGYKKAILDYDTLLLVNMLSEFRERNYETFAQKISPTLKDSILQSNYFKIISITDIDNQTTSLKLYHLINTGSLFVDNVMVEEFYEEFNRDRCYATINDNQDEIYTIQFFHFERQIQPLSYYLKR